MNHIQPFYMVFTQVSVPRVHIKGLGNEGEKEEIRRLFSQFGPLTNVWIATRPPGFAYVFYETFEDAEKAVEYFNGKEVCGVTVTVQLSPIENKRSESPVEELPAVEDEVERVSNGSDYEVNDNRFYDSDPDSKQDYERERYNESGYRQSRGSRGNYYRSGPSNRRGRPYNRFRGRGRGHFSNYRDRGDDRRHSFPERRGRGRGWNDHGDGGYRPRGRGQREYRDSYRPRGRGRGSGDRMQRMSDNYSLRHYDRGGGEFRQRGRQESQGYDRFSSGDRSREYREKPYYDRNRSDSARYSSPPPLERHPPDHSSHKRSRREPPMDSEYIAKQFRMKHFKNGREGDRDFGETSRATDRRHGDIEYRQSRRSGKEDFYLQREKEYTRSRDSDIAGYEKHSSRKSYRETERSSLPHSEHHQSRKHRSIDNSYPQSYLKKEYASAPWESDNIRDRSPHGSPVRSRYLEQYQSPPERYRYSNLQREESHSRSKSVSSRGSTSDTSRGPSASPSPPRHKRSILDYRSPSPPLSRSPSPLLDTYRSKHRHSTRQELPSPPRSPVYRSPSPAYKLTDRALFPKSPQYEPRPPTYSPSSPAYAPFTSLTPSYEKKGKYADRDYIDSKRPMEYERVKNRSADYSEKKSKREVRDHDRDRKIVYEEKTAKDRYIEVEPRTLTGHDETRLHGRLSDSFDLVRSSSSRHSTPPPPPSRRSHGSLKRRRSTLKDEYEDRAENVSRRSIQDSPPMSSRMMKGH